MTIEDVNVLKDVAVEKSVIFTAFKPQLIVEAQKVCEAVTFYKSAFGAVEIGRSLFLKRKADEDLPPILTSELKLAGISFVVCDISTISDSTAKPEGTNMSIILETDDVEAAVAKSVAAGAVKVGEVTDNVTDGGVKGKVTDPYGFTWIFFSPTKKTENDENKEV